MLCFRWLHLFGRHQVLARLDAAEEQKLRQSALRRARENLLQPDRSLQRLALLESVASISHVRTVDNDSGPCLLLLLLPGVFRFRPTRRVAIGVRCIARR